MGVGRANNKETMQYRFVQKFYLLHTLADYYACVGAFGYREFA